MKKIKYLLSFVFLLAIISCGEDFVDRQNLYEKLDVDYYSNASDIQEALTGAYSCLPEESQTEAVRKKGSGHRDFE